MNGDLYAVVSIPTPSIQLIKNDVKPVLVLGKESSADKKAVQPVCQTFKRVSLNKTPMFPFWVPVFITIPCLTFLGSVVVAGKDKLKGLWT